LANNQGKWESSMGNCNGRHIPQQQLLRQLNNESAHGSKRRE
jgi:hypothetical protein